MGRFTAVEGAKLRELEAMIGTLDLSAPGELHQVHEQLALLLRSPLSMSFGVELENGFFHPVGHQGYGTTEKFVALTTRSFREPMGNWARYNPLRPEQNQRNRALNTLELLRFAGTIEPAILSFAIGKLLGFRSYARQLRALICDGSNLLNWVGVLREGEFSSREGALLQRLIPAFRRRLKAERALEHLPLTDGALARLLDEIPRAAYLLNARGVIEYANEAARHRLAQQPCELRGALVRALRSPEGTDVFDVTRLSAPRSPGRWLALERSEPADPTPRVARLRARWGLTPREAQVLELAAFGAASKEIASKLGCAESTVEVHLSRVMQKAHADNRAALVARLWTAQ